MERTLSPIRILETATIAARYPMVEKFLPAIIAILLLGGLPPGARGDEPQPPAAEATASAAQGQDAADREAGDLEKEGEPAAPPQHEEDPCTWHLAEQPLQEQSREVLRSWSCYSFRWFDSWGGDQYDFDETAVNGRLLLGLEYRTYDGFDPRLRFKVRAPLPNISRRLDLLLGRLDEDAYLADTQGQDPDFFNPGVTDRGEEESWLLGLGHRRKERGAQGWDWSVGIRLNVPPRPYAKVRYYFDRQFTDRFDMRFRQTVFWRSNEGFGTTSRGDFAYGLNSGNIMRWEGIATVSEATEGMQWYFGQTWYHRLRNGTALSLLTFANGETDDPVSVQDTGFKLVWRRPFTRDYIYLSMGPTLTWPREEPEEDREMSPGFGVWLEVQFGQWRY